MTDREYPRWVHAAGHKSIVVETPEDEAAFIAATASVEAPSAAALVSAPTHLAPPQRYSHRSFEGMRDGQIGGFNDEPDPEGKWVRWSDVASLFGRNLLTAAPVVEELPPVAADAADVPVVAKRPGGWPKGKPRSAKEAAVN